MPRFDRTYRLLVGKAGGQGIEILPPLQITFEIEKDTKEEPNYHKVRVWNLKPETRKVLETPDNFMVLYAGYSQDNGALLIASGHIHFGYTYLDGADVITEIEVLDGYINIRDTAVSLGYGPGAKASFIIADIAKQMGLELISGPNLPDRVWQNGFSYYGAAHVALHKIVAGTGLEWSIQNGTLQVLEKRGVTQRQGIILVAPDSGLIGYPERTRLGAREKAKVKDQVSGDNKTITKNKQQVDGWKVNSLLLPTVNPGDLIKLESRSVNGWFRIESVRHSGDYSGPGNWQTELQLVDRDAPPPNPNKKPKQTKVSAK